MHRIRQRWDFPTIPGLRPTAPEPGFINPVLDYDWGPQFDPIDASGVPTNEPPRIRQVIRMLVPRVNADGNEIGGVPVVLHDAPLGTYLGWNITAEGFHKDKLCMYAGGMIPFARTLRSAKHPVIRGCRSRSGMATTRAMSRR